MAGHGTFEDVAEELFRKLQALTPRHFFYLILFDDNAHLMPSRTLLPATPFNVQKMVGWLRNQRPNGSTDPT